MASSRAVRVEESLFKNRYGRRPSSSSVASAQPSQHPANQAIKAISIPSPGAKEEIHYLIKHINKKTDGAAFTSASEEVGYLLQNL